jgi:hypothetical protein
MRSIGVGGAVVSVVVVVCFELLLVVVVVVVVDVVDEVVVVVVEVVVGAAVVVVVSTVEGAPAATVRINRGRTPDTLGFSRDSIIFCEITASLADRISQSTEPPRLFSTSRTN